jgi:hypothetical protein
VGIATGPLLPIGTYLTDGTHLGRVIDAMPDRVWMEDAMTLELSELSVMGMVEWEIVPHKDAEAV